MTTSFIILSLAIIYLIIALPAILQPKKTKTVIENLMFEEKHYPLFSIMSFLFAFLVLSVNWNISISANGLIAIFGWSALLKGIMLLYFPNFMKKITKYFLKSTLFIRIMGVFLLIISGLLTYLSTIA